MIRFFRNNAPSKSAKALARKDVLTHITEELRPLSSRVSGSRITVNTLDDCRVHLDFITNNYADKDEIDLNASMSFQRNGEEFEWVDLFHLIKSIQGSKNHRPLNIPKKEDWEGSAFQKQIQLVVKPLLEVLLTDGTKRVKFLNGEAVAGEGGQKLQLGQIEDDAWIRNDSLRLANWFKERQ